jgi:hypothetical protein
MSIKIRLGYILCAIDALPVRINASRDHPQRGFRIGPARHELFNMPEKEYDVLGFSHGRDPAAGQTRILCLRAELDGKPNRAR